MVSQDISFESPEDNLLYDDLLLQIAEEGSGEVLRFWESSVHFIVLGRIGKPEEDLCKDAVLADHIPVLRRSSGGGTVVQGPGSLNFSLVLNKDRRPELQDLHRSYHVILSKVIMALQQCGVVCEFRPLCDVVVPEGELKISGNAQRRGKRHVLHHGTILYGMDLDCISRYLTMPQDRPEYRRGRPHKDFVTNIPLDTGVFKMAMAEVWGARPVTVKLTPDEHRALAELRRTKIPRIFL